MRDGYRTNFIRACNGHGAAKRVHLKQFTLLFLLYSNWFINMYQFPRAVFIEMVASTSTPDSKRMHFHDFDNKCSHSSTNTCYNRRLFLVSCALKKIPIDYRPYLNWKYSCRQTKSRKVAIKVWRNFPICFSEVECTTVQMDVIRKQLLVSCRFFVQGEDCVINFLIERVRNSNVCVSLYPWCYKFTLIQKIRKI